MTYDKGFKYLKVRVGQANNGRIYLIVIQMEEDDNGKSLITLTISNKNLKAEDIVNKIYNEFNGEKIEEGLPGMFTAMKIDNKKEEALEWLQSIAAMHKVDNK